MFVNDESWRTIVADPSSVQRAEDLLPVEDFRGLFPKFGRKTFVEALTEASFNVFK